MEVFGSFYDGIRGREWGGGVFKFSVDCAVGFGWGEYCVFVWSDVNVRLSDSFGKGCFLFMRTFGVKK